MKRCPYCAEEIQNAAVKCRHCGSALDTADAKWRVFRRDFAGLSAFEQAERRSQMSPEQLAALEEQPAAPIAGTTIVQIQPAWSPGVAAVLSLVIPGAGQMYKGHVGSGLVWLLCVAVGYVAFIVPGIILHLACIVSAASGDPAAPLSTAQSSARRKPTQEERDRVRAQNANLAKFGGLGLAAVIALFAVVVIAGSILHPTPRPTTTTATPSKVIVNQDDLIFLVSKFGPPDRDESAEHETPRPPIVTRTLTFTDQHVRAVYRANVPMGTPPPYDGSWALVGFIDTAKLTKLTPGDAMTRLQQRHQPTTRR